MAAVAARSAAAAPGCVDGHSWLPSSAKMSSTTTCLWRFVARMLLGPACHREPAPADHPDLTMYLYSSISHEGTSISTCHSSYLTRSLSMGTALSGFQLPRVGPAPTTHTCSPNSTCFFTWKRTLTLGLGARTGGGATTGSGTGSGTGTPAVPISCWARMRVATPLAGLVQLMYAPANFASSRPPGLLLESDEILFPWGERGAALELAMRAPGRADGRVDVGCCIASGTPPNFDETKAFMPHAKEASPNERGCLGAIR
mmetsp:Transcript_54465/g.173063  ORF Transcript_54465/g.173063 Transcript_54465/m.173063 type:complete len:258 (+) Transcript_54465:1150-1923(+)